MPSPKPKTKKGVTRLGPRIWPQTTDKKPKMSKGREQKLVSGKKGVALGEIGRIKRKSNLVQ